MENGRIVAEIAADASQYAAGIRRAVQETRRFIDDVKKASTSAQIFNASDLAKEAKDAARIITQRFGAEFESRQTDLRAKLFGGALSPEQWALQGAKNAKAYNDAVLARANALQSAGKLSPAAYSEIVNGLKDAGLKASQLAAKAAGANPLLGNLTTQGQRAAQTLLNGFGREYQDRVLTLRENFRRGLIDKAAYTSGGREAAEAYNAGIGAGLDKLRDSGKLTENIRQALVNSLKDAGDAGGQAAATGILARLAAVRSDVTRLASGFSNVGRTLSFAITAPVLGIAALAVRAATDAQSAAARMAAVFGASTDTVNAKLAALRLTVPATTAQLQDAVTEANGIFRSYGIAANASRTLSVATVKLAGDFAVFKRVDLETSLSAIESALRGNGRAVAKYGVDISESTLKQEGLRTGLIKQGQSLTDAGKAVAAFQILLREVGPASDYAAQHVLTAGEQLALVKSDINDTAVAIGNELLPTVLSIARAFDTFVKFVRDVDPAIKRVIIVIAGLAATVGPILLTLGAFLRIVAAIGTAAELAAGTGLAAFLASLGLVGAAVAVGGVLIAGLVAFYALIHKNDDNGRTLGGGLDAYTASLNAMTTAQIKANIAQLEGADTAYKAEQRRLSIEAVGAKTLANSLGAGTAAGRAAAADEADRVSRIQLLNRYLNENRARLEANQTALEAHTKTAAAAKQQMDELRDAFKGLGAATGAAGSGPTALEAMATAARNALESVRGLKEANQLSVSDVSVLLDTYGKVAATVERIGTSQEKGAAQLRQAYGEIAKALPAILGAGHVSVGVTLDKSLPLDFADEVKKALKAAGGQADVFIGDTLLRASNDAGRIITAALRNAIVSPLPGLSVAPVIKATIDTSGVTGGLRRMALTLGTTGDRLRLFADDTFALAPLATLIRNVASGFDVLSNSVGNIAASFADPVTSLGTVFRGFGHSVELAGRGIVAVFSTIGKTILSALNPLNVFKQFGEQIGTALSPALDALKGPLTSLATVVADGLTPVFQALQPVVDALVPLIRELFNAIGPILVALAPLLKVVVTIVTALLPIIKAIAIAFTYLGQIVLTIASLLTRFFGNLIIGFGKVIEVIATAVDKLPFVSAKGAINFAKDIQNMGKGMLQVADEFKDASAALGDAREQIRQGNYSDLASGSAAAATALNATAEAANNVTDQLKFVPDGFRVAFERFRATLPQVAGGGVPSRPAVPAPLPSVPFPGGLTDGGGVIVQITGDLNIQADSTSTVASIVEDIVRSSGSLAQAATGTSANASKFLLQSARNVRLKSA